MVSAVRVMSSSPSPLILPFSLAVTTDPMAEDPAGTATAPLTLTECATVAGKLWPVWLDLEDNAVPSLTEMVVPAGMTTGGGGGGGSAAAGAGAGALSGLAAAA